MSVPVKSPIVPVSQLKKSLYYEAKQISNNNPATTPPQYTHLLLGEGGATKPMGGRVGLR